MLDGERSRGGGGDLGVLDGERSRGERSGGC